MKASVQGAHCGIGVVSAGGEKTAFRIGERYYRLTPNRFMLWRLGRIFGCRINHFSSLRVTVSPGVVFYRQCDTEEGVKLQWWTITDDGLLRLQRAKLTGFTATILDSAISLFGKGEFFTPQELWGCCSQSASIQNEDRFWTTLHKLLSMGVLSPESHLPFAIDNPVEHLDQCAQKISVDLPFKISVLNEVLSTDLASASCREYTKTCQLLNSIVDEPVSATRSTVIDHFVNIDGRISSKAYNLIQSEVRQYFSLIRNCRLANDNYLFRQRLLSFFKTAGLCNKKITISELQGLIKDFSVEDMLRSSDSSLSEVLVSLEQQVRSAYQHPMTNGDEHSLARMPNISLTVSDQKLLRDNTLLPFEASVRIGAKELSDLNDGQFELIVEMASFPGLLRGRHEWISRHSKIKPSLETRLVFEGFRSFNDDSAAIVELCTEKICDAMNATARPVLADYELELYCYRSRMPRERVLSRDDVEFRLDSNGNSSFHIRKTGRKIFFVCTSTVFHTGDLLFDTLIALGAPQVQPTASSLAICPDLNELFRYHPRITFGRVVVRPGFWRFRPKQLLSKLEKSEYRRSSGVSSRTYKTFQRLYSAKRLQHSFGIPRFAFLRTDYEKKPLPLDFLSPFSLDTLSAEVRKATNWVEIVECIPDLDNCFASDSNDKRYAIELMLMIH
ncbi:lantibiotic dehydratase [uncultured Gimesia sp.]|uniref:lantibiotic dehydratase n=1 Tax=uncultured Gimesia sp. TaxID=1678688 RepID=UPI0030DD1E3C|tara:strand:+ start:6876 stop:8894 length:2019 start_codon:yes stop_codon:yes gene_type:complete